MYRGDQDVVGEKCVLDDNENLRFEKIASSNAWKEYYYHPLNQELLRSK